MESTIMPIMINGINNQDTLRRSQFMEIFSLKQVIRKFGQKGYEATYGEMLKLNQRTQLKLIKVVDFNLRQRKRAL